MKDKKIQSNIQAYLKIHRYILYLTSKWRFFQMREEKKSPILTWSDLCSLPEEWCVIFVNWATSWVQRVRPCLSKLCHFFCFFFSPQTDPSNRVPEIVSFAHEANFPLRTTTGDIIFNIFLINFILLQLTKAAN